MSTLALDWRPNCAATKEQIEANRKAEADTVIAELIRPRTLNERIEEYEREQEDAEA